MKRTNKFSHYWDKGNDLLCTIGSALLIFAITVFLFLLFVFLGLSLFIGMTKIIYFILC